MYCSKCYREKCDNAVLRLRQKGQKDEAAAIDPLKAAAIGRLREILHVRRCEATSRCGGRGACEPGPQDDVPGVKYSEIKKGQALGEGSFGKVYKGTCRGKVVAIKECVCEDPGLVEMLLMEMRYLQRFRHPHLISFLFCCNEGPRVAVCMEFAEGGSLESLLYGKRQQKLDLKTQVRMMGQVAQGLTYIHDRDVVHRDLKSENIVLTKSMDAKICDFGLCITLERTHLTIRDVAGTPIYMAPEQFPANGNTKVTDRADIWAMGCIIMEVNSRRRPFEKLLGSMIIEKISDHLCVKRMPPAIPPECDHRLVVVIQACLRTEAKTRPSARMLEEALTCFGLLLAKDM